MRCNAYTFLPFDICDAKVLKTKINKALVRDKVSLAKAIKGESLIKILL